MRTVTLCPSVTEGWLEIDKHYSLELCLSISNLRLSGAGVFSIYNGVRVCGRNRTEAREREWAEGTVSSLPSTLTVRIKLCHNTGIARSGCGVRASITSYA